jgi:hypothetical protein
MKPQKYKSLALAATLPLFYISVMIVAVVSSYESPSFIRRLLTMLVLAVVLSALEVDRRGRIVEPPPIVMRLEYVPRPLLRSRPFRPHYRRALARRQFMVD